MNVARHLGPRTCMACETAKLVPEVIGGGIAEGYLLGVAGALSSPSEHQRFLEGDGLCPQHAADLKTFVHGEEDHMRARLTAAAHTTDSGRAVGVYDVPAGTPKRECRSCGAPIFWIETPRGKRMPVNPEGTSHFATCPQASQHRRRA